MHEISGYPDPTDNSFVKSLQESAKRLTGRPVRRKDPVDRQMLQTLCDSHAGVTTVLISAIYSYQNYSPLVSPQSLKSNLSDVSRSHHVVLFLLNI